MATRKLTCEYAIRLPGQTRDGRPLHTLGMGDTAALCGEPATEHVITTAPGHSYVVVRCPEHTS